MNYFTSIEHTGGQYVGVAFNAANNTPVFRSKPYSDQSLALNEVNAFLSGQPTSGNQPIVNSAAYTVTSPAQQPPRKCCGR